MKSTLWLWEKKDNKIILDELVLFKEYQKSIPNGYRGQMELKDIPKNKTLKQLRYYYGVILPAFSNETGYVLKNEYGDNEADIILKKTYLTVHKGQKNEYVRNKRDLTTKEMAEFIDNCIYCLAQLGVCVPSPESMIGGIKNEQNDRN